MKRLHQIKDQEVQKWEWEKKLAKSKKKKRLTIAQIERRDNYKWGAMFLIVFISVYIYLASFLEMDKTQSHIDIQLKTLNLLKEELALTANKVEKMKRSDALSKKAKTIGLVDSKPEIIIVNTKLNND